MYGKDHSWNMDHKIIKVAILILWMPFNSNNSTADAFEAYDIQLE